MKSNNYPIVIRLLLVCLLAAGMDNAIFSQDNSVITPGAYGGGVPVSYIRSWDALAPQSDANLLMGSAITAVRQNTQYFDGLGRPIQAVIKQGAYPTGGSAVDMVTAMVYDSLGRQVRQYLPFAANTTGGNTSVSDGLFKLNPFQQQNYFYSDANSSSPIKGQGETYYYGKTEFEASPLNRPIKTFAPGNAWVNQGRGIETKYWINKITDSVRIWSVTDSTNTFGGYASSAIYAAGELYKTVTIDEQSNQVIEFKDKEGQVLLKKVQLTASDNGSGSGHVGWLCTYYIYDDLGQLRAIVQPRGVELLMQNSWNMTALSGAILAEQCFRYEYDDQERKIMDKVPGAGAVYMVYDIKNRVVLSQDANMRTSNKWFYTLYDNLNRPIETGLLNSSASRVAHQGAATAAGTTSYPNLSGQTYEMLTQTFYDNYDWFSGSKTHTAFYDSHFETPSNTIYPYPQPVTDGGLKVLRGLVTGMLVKVLGTTTYLANFNFYDDKGRLIQIQKANLDGGLEYITTQYTWSGQPYIVITVHSKDVVASQTGIAVTKNTYDNLGRIVKVEKKVSNSKVNGGTMSSYLTISDNEYDALGQLRTKSIGRQKDASGTYTNTPMETLTYDRNIRGWLLGANRDFAKSISSVTNYFGFDLGYNNPSLGGLGSYAGSGIFNGNITGMLWKSSGDAQIRKYDFGYDNTGRLLKADFNQYTSSSFNRNAGIDFSIKIGDGTNATSAYDANGNILKMQQWGWTGTGSQQIDSLTYNYYTNTNRLMNVIDGKNNNNTKLGDFRYSSNYYTGSKPSSAQDYSYDVNGNLTSDFNKDITAGGITYNHLNLPQTVFVTNKGNIYYTYDALGNKYSKKVVEGSTTTITIYQNGNVYKNDTLEYITMEEGRIRFDPFQNKLHYDYFIKDHLGNIRMVLTEQKDTAFYPAVTFEDANAATEQLYYENANLEKTTRPANFNNSSQNGSKVQLLRKNTQSIGAGKLLKVMAKDRIHVKVEYYIQNDATNNSDANGLSAVISSLTSLLNSSPVTRGFHGGGSTITNNLNNTSAFTTLLAPQGLSQSSPMPKAYLNIFFFDEQFKFVEQNSEIIQVNTKGSAQVILRSGSQAKAATKNGYVYVYVSNESNNLVYFDNLQVSHERGPITEETHYYPFGLTMAGISSQSLAFGKENKKKYNGIEWQNDLGLNEYDAFFRELDPQVGRWWQIDPKIESMEHWSPYASNYDNPIAYSDPLGDEPEDEDGGPIRPILGPMMSGGLINSVVSAVNTVTDAVVTSAKQVLIVAGGLANGILNQASLGTWPKDGIGGASGLSGGEQDLYNASSTVGQYTPLPLPGSAPGASISPVGAPVMGMPVSPSVPFVLPKIDRVNASSSSSSSSNSGRSGKQERLREIGKDDKASSADRGWIRNEQRHIETGNRKTIRNPGNSRNSPSGGKVLAHPRGKRAKDGHSYKDAKLQDTDLHKLEHKYGGYR